LIFDGAGKVTRDFFVAGPPSMPVYVLGGREPVLFDAGFSSLARFYRAQIEEFLPRPPKMLFLTHVHFDHCGAAGYFKEYFPGLEVAASQKAADILKRPNAVKLITDLNRQVGRQAQAAGSQKVSEDPFLPFTVDRILAGGDTIELADGLRIEVLAAPGHTWDFLSYYVPQKKILVASEAVGVAQPDGQIIPEFLVDYQAYLDSLQKLAALDVEVLCQGHHYVFLGPAVKDFLGRALTAALEFRTRVLRLLDTHGGDTGKVIQIIKAEQYDPQPHPKQAEAAYLMNLTARVKHLAQTAR